MISDISIVSIILTILLVGASLAGLILAFQKMMYKLLDDLRQEMRDMRQEMLEIRKEMLEMRQEMRDMRQEMLDMRQEMLNMRKGQADFREQVAGRLGKVEGLRMASGNS